MWSCYRVCLCVLGYRREEDCGFRLHLEQVSPRTWYSTLRTIHVLLSQNNKQKQRDEKESLKDIRHLAHPWGYICQFLLPPLQSVLSTAIHRGRPLPWQPGEGLLSCVFPSQDWFVQQICLGILHVSAAGTRWRIKSMVMTVPPELKASNADRREPDTPWRSRFMGGESIYHEVDEVGQSLPSPHGGRPSSLWEG